MREKYILPVVAQQDIINDFRFMVSHIHDTYKQFFNSLCHTYNLFEPQLTNISQLFANDNSVFLEAFDKIDSECKLNKAIQQTFSYVHPNEVIIGTSATGKPITCSYIPITSVLKLVLSNNDFSEQIMTNSYIHSEDDLLSSFVDASYFKEHSVFSKDPNAIRLHFYADEFEVCNPLGSKRGKHKVLAVYYYIGNTNCKLWSKNKFIHLCLLVRYKDLQNCDPICTRFFKPIISELQDLASTGIHFQTEGLTQHRLVAMATFSADNLTAHSLAGFQRNFTQGRVCRFCMACRDQISLSFTEDTFTLRTKAVHDYHLQAIEENESNRQVYGVYHRCPLLDIFYFDVSFFVPDIMHDLLEGVIPNLLHRVIVNIFRSKKLTLEQLNSSLEKACRGLTNLPNAFTLRSLLPSGSIDASASQKWQLFQILPQILAKSYELGDPTFASKKCN